jgi:hypothetical protein
MEIENPYALTLKMETECKRTAAKHLRFFKNRYERAIGKRGYRYTFVPVVECKAGNLHYHLVVNRPAEMSPSIYTEKVMGIIPKVKQMHRHYNKLEEVYGLDRWVNYMTKFQNKEDEFDILNLSR